MHACTVERDGEHIHIRSTYVWLAPAPACCTVLITRYVTFVASLVARTTGELSETSGYYYYSAYSS
jgi:hypothetical protein